MMSDLVKNPFAEFEDKADPRVPTATLQIYQAISKYLERKETGTANRCSSATMCVRRRWYQNNGEEGETLTPRKIVNFLLGDLSERALLYFIKHSLVGPGRLYSEINLGESLGSIHFQGKEIELYAQKTLRFNIKDIEITGHADGFGKRNSDGKWELIECKSAANFGFKSFKDAGPPEDYLKQAHALMLTEYAQSLGIEHVRFFYLRKETGHIWDQVHGFSSELAKKVVSEFIQSNQKALPEAPFSFVPEVVRRKATGRASVPWQCQYCPYLKKCKGEYVIEWKPDQWGNMKPLYIFENIKEFENAF